MDVVHATTLACIRQRQRHLQEMSAQGVTRTITNDIKMLVDAMREEGDESKTDVSFIEEINVDGGR